MVRDPRRDGSRRRDGVPPRPRRVPSPWICPIALVRAREGNLPEREDPRVSRVRGQRAVPPIDGLSRVAAGGGGGGFWGGGPRRMGTEHVPPRIYKET